MKKMISTIMICICVFMEAVVLTGCDAAKRDKGTEAEGKTKNKEAVCFMVVNTANSQRPNMNSPLVQNTVYDTILNYGYISVINVDGNVEMVLAKSYDIDERFKGASVNRLKADARAKTENFIKTLQNVIADDPEVDYLEGFRLAVRSLASLEGYTSKRIVVLGSGLSTTGVLDFRNNLLSAEASVIADILEEKEALPDFSYITVDWQQMGDTAEPQKALLPNQKKRLQEIWSNIIERTGGKVTFDQFIPSPVDESIEYPAVSVVELPADTPVNFDSAEFESQISESSEFATPVILPEDEVCFKADSAEFCSPDKAMETIRLIAEYMLYENSSISLLLAGCIAGDSDSEEGYLLSLQRAEMVKKALIKLNVPAERLVTRGLGCSDPWHIPGIGYKDKLAAQNRKVVLLDSTTELARELLSY